MGLGIIPELTFALQNQYALLKVVPLASDRLLIILQLCIQMVNSQLN